MNSDKNMSPASRSRSFVFAANGIVQLFRQEPNARLHVIATAMVIAAGIWRHVQPWQWAALAFAAGIVWIAEAFNTCIEKLCDFSCDNKWHPSVKIIKDISAAAVLLAAGTSLIIGIIVFFC